jgi:hypothetical protein
MSLTAKAWMDKLLAAAPPVVRKPAKPKANEPIAVQEKSAAQTKDKTGQNHTAETIQSSAIAAGSIGVLSAPLAEGIGSGLGGGDGFSTVGILGPISLLAYLSIVHGIEQINEKKQETVIAKNNTSIDYANGKGRPKDLERGMSANQKGQFQREIENYKREYGMRPDDNLPWEILVLLAEEVKEMFK